jgi:glycosyltransferase involved in cell wall biosynthesis
MIDRYHQSPSLRIAVIAHSLRVAGGLYVGHNLIKALISAAPQHSYIFVVPVLCGYDTIGFDRKHQVVYYKRQGGNLGRWLYDLFSLPKLVRQFRADIILALDNKGINYPPCPQAILCQDAHLFTPPKDYPQDVLTKRAIKAYLRWRLGRNLRRSQLLLCQTRVAEAKLRDFFKYDGRTMVCGCAVPKANMIENSGCALPKAVARARHKFILLSIARYYPHKNLELLVDAFDKFREDLRDVALVITIAPNQHPRARRLLRAIERLGLAEQIVNVGSLPHSKVARYYAHCHALVAPTLLESFGMTYIEAMHFGVPIITSDRDFARGVCGDAALYFDPLDSRSLKDTILRVKDNPTLTQNLLANAKKQLKLQSLSWNEIAGNTVEELQKTVAELKQASGIQKA